MRQKTGDPAIACICEPENCRFIEQQQFHSVQIGLTICLPVWNVIPDVAICTNIG